MAAASEVPVGGPEVGLRTWAEARQEHGGLLEPAADAWLADLHASLQAEHIKSVQRHDQAEQTIRDQQSVIEALRGSVTDLDVRLQALTNTAANVAKETYDRLVSDERYIQRFQVAVGESVEQQRSQME